MKTRISKLLKQNGITQQEMASELGISRQNFHNKLTGDKLTKSHLEFIAKRLDVPVSFLINGIRPDEGKLQSDHHRMVIESLRKEKHYLEQLLAETRARINGLEELLRLSRSKNQ